MSYKRQYAGPLNDRGYNAIRVPRAGIMPLDVLGRTKGELAQLGRLEDLLIEAPESVPTATAQPAAGFDALSTGGVSGDVGLSLLKGLLEPLGVGGASLSASWSSAHQVEVSYDELTTWSASMAQAGALIDRCGLNTEGAALRAFFTGPRGAVYLISEVLYSGAFTIVTSSQGAGGGEASVPLHELAADVSGGVQLERGRDGALHHHGEPLAIGFRCLRIRQDRKGRVALETAPASGPLSFGGHHELPLGELLVEGDWLDLS